MDERIGNTTDQEESPKKVVETNGINVKKENDTDAKDLVGNSILGRAEKSPTVSRNDRQIKKVARSATVVEDPKITHQKNRKKATFKKPALTDQD